MADIEHWSQGSWESDAKGINQARRHLGSRLRRAREYRGLTQTEAGEDAGLTLDQYALMEQGRRPLTQESAEKLALAWDCKTSDLLVNQCMPSAPNDPVARLKFIRDRQEAFRSGKVKTDPSGTEGRQPGKKGS